MRGLTFTSTSRRVMAAGLALVATTSAACSDAVTEPKPVVNVPTTASAIEIQPIFFKTATLNVIDVNGNPLSPTCGALDAKFEGEYAIVLKHKAL